MNNNAKYEEQNFKVMFQCCSESEIMSCNCFTNNKYTAKGVF